MQARNNFIIVVIFIISNLFLFVSFLPNFYEASVVDLMPQDRTMIWGEHIYTYDYNVYLSKIRQGTEGRWTIVDKYDNHVEQKGVLLQMLYLLTGKLGSLLKLDPVLSFHLLRTVVSFIFILVIFYLNFFYLKKPWLVLTGVLLSLLAASFPVFYRYLGETWVGQHMAWWQEMDVLKRISYIPHYTLNYIIISVFSILIYSSSKKFEARNTKSETNSNVQKLKDQNVSNFGHLNFNIVSKFGFRISDLILNRSFLTICFFLFFSFFIHPSAPLLFFFMWSIFHFLNLVWFGSYRGKTILNLIGQTLTLVLVAAIPFFYLKSVTANYPWKALVEFDQTNRLTVDFKEYILALGPVFFTGILGLIVVFIKKNQRLLSLASWLLAAFLAIIIFKKIPLFAELRFVQTANHIPLAILSVYFFVELSKVFPSVFIKFITAITIIMIISLGLVQSYFSIKAQTDFIHQRAVAGNPLVPYPPQVMYPLKDFYNALNWLEKNTPRNSVVLSKITAGNYIPAHSGNFVYLGHNPETPQYPQKVEMVNQFFSGTMDPQNALKFLKTQNLSYIFYGPQEKENPAYNPKNYPFLKEMFTSGYVSLYKVN